MEDGDKAAAAWFQDYVKHKGSAPDTASQLNVFIKNRGGSLRYALIREIVHRCGSEDPSPPQASQRIGVNALSGTPSTASTAEPQSARRQTPEVPELVEHEGDDRLKAWIQRIGRCNQSDLEEVFVSLPVEAQSDPEVAGAMVRRSPVTMRSVPKSLTSDRDFMRRMVNQCGVRLQFAAEHLKEDRDLVLAAISNDGAAIEFAAERLRADRDLVLTSVQRYNGNIDRHPLRFASNPLQVDRELVLLSIQRDCDLIRASWFPLALKDDHAFMRLMIDENPARLQFASDALKSDRELVLCALERDAFALRFASASLRDDFTVVLAAMSSNRDAFRYASAALRARPAEFLGLLNMKKVVCLHGSVSGDMVDIHVSAVDGTDIADLLLPLTLDVGQLKVALCADTGLPGDHFLMLSPCGLQLNEDADSLRLSELF